MTPRIALLIVAICMLFSMEALATREPRPIKPDHRVRTIQFQPDAVYKYTGYYRYQTSIEFGQDEVIQTISMGDPTGWMMNPSGSRLFLKPVEQDATTNMTLITNKHLYLFELHARDTDDINDPDLTFILRFLYPDESDMQFISNDGTDSVPSLDIKENPGKYNFRYSISGPETTAPIRIFDDGEFTYFEFRDKNTEVPAFFWVDDKGDENLINYRTRGNYIVVERVANRYTLRHGSDVVCVFNEARQSLTRK